MSLRVIGGSAKRMKLKPVPGRGTRPISDRAKEALFNILAEDIRSARFLDLFAGTGSVGIEALSRGAAHALFIELNRSAIAVIRANLRHTRLIDRAAVRQRSAFDVLAQPPSQPFDFIYVAPPQYREMWKATLAALSTAAAWHHPQTTVIVQIDPQEYEPQARFAHLSEYDRRKYGRTLLLFYQFVDFVDDFVDDFAD